VKIDPATGKISTNRENPFDFETQTQIIIQVAATDLENHRSIVTVTLNVIDSNDTPPTLSLVIKNKLFSFKNVTYLINCKIL